MSAATSLETEAPLSETGVVMQNTPPLLETGVQALAISDPPRLPGSFTPAPVTVVRSTPSRQTDGHTPFTSLPDATPATNLPGMPAQQFPPPGPTAQVSQTFLPPTQDGLSSLGFPSAPPTISLPTVAPTISLDPTPNLIPASSV
jgi:hypothetical protein